VLLTGRKRKHGAGIGRCPRGFTPYLAFAAQTNDAPSTVCLWRPYLVHRPSSSRVPVPPAAGLLTPDALHRLDRMELRARLIVEGFMAGLHRSPYHGFSVEFAEHRPYHTGDALRHVDWKVLARKDRLFVKQYEEETNLRHWVVLDTSASMRYQGAGPVTKLEYGATLAAALHYLMGHQRDATGLVAFDDTLHTLIPPRSTQGHLRGLLATLDRLVRATPERKAPAQTRAAAALHEVAERIPRRALVVVISDLYETDAGADDDAGVLRALRHLRHRGHEVLLFHLMDDATERRLDLPDLPVTLRDAETGQEVTLQPAQFREDYTAAVGAWTERLRRRCREMHVDLVELDTARPFADALASYLNKRGRLF